MRSATTATAAQAADQYAARITATLDEPGRRPVVDTYLRGLRAVAGTHVTDADAMDLLVHHALTLPLFDALFGGYPFLAHNPISRALDGPLRTLAAAGALKLDEDEQSLRVLYQRARDRAASITNHEDRQPLVCELCEDFFRTALPRAAARLGIVFTPVEVVDYMLRSTDQALRKSHGRGLTDEGVQVVDPFTGAGIFFVRLLQSDLVKPDDLVRKYRHEMHGHEIVPLSWYIATVNIEIAYAERTRRYLPFPGLKLVDTFSGELSCCDGSDVL